MTALHSYRAYGLNLRSPIPLPELLPGEGGGGISIHMGAPDETLPRPAAFVEGRYTVLDSRTVGLFWAGVGTFRVRDGRRVYVEPAAGTDEGLIRLFLLGPVLAILLHRRGQTVLHAGAVSLNGGDSEGAGAVAFLGGTGEGKSTTVAAFHRAGHRALTDDLVAFPSAEPESLGRTEPEILTTHPGYPQIKLSREAARALGIGPESLTSLPMTPPRSPRLAYRFPDAFSPAPLPLRHLYLLASGPEIKVEPLDPKAAFMEVMRHAYLAGHLPPEESGVLFQQMARLLRHVPVSRLTRQRRLEEIMEVVRAVKEHQERLAAG